MAEPLELALLDLALDYLKEYTHPEAISLCISTVQQIVEDLRAEAVRLCVKLTDFSENDVLSFDAQDAISIANGCQFAEADSAFSALSKILFLENSVADFQKLGAGYFYRDDFLAAAEDFIKLIYRARIQVDDAARLASSKGRARGSKTPKRAIAVYALFKRLRKENPSVDFYQLTTKAKNLFRKNLDYQNHGLECRTRHGEETFFIFPNQGLDPKYPAAQYPFVQNDRPSYPISELRQSQTVSSTTLAKHFSRKR